MKRAVIIAEGRKQRVGYRDLVPVEDPYTLHPTPYTLHLTPKTLHLISGLLAVLVLVVLALVSIPTTAVAAAGSHDAQAGYITSINIIASSRTEHWQGYYGSLAGIPPNATEYPGYFFNTSAPNVSSIRPIELGISSFAPGEYLLITDSDSLNVSSLQAGDTSMINFITGTGYDSGTNTFNDISTFYNIPVRGNIPNVPTVYIKGTGLMSFREGLLRDGNNSVFIAPIEVAMPGYNETPCNFQFILPTNYSCPITYYMYYLSVTVSPSTISLTAYPEVIEANGIDTSTITAFVTDEFGRGVNGTEVTFSTTHGSIESPKTTVNGIATTILTSSTSPGTAVMEANAIVNGIPVSDTVSVVFTKTAEAKTNETIENANIIIEGTDISISNATVTLKEGVITLDTSIENATIIAGNITAGAVISISIEGGALEITLGENATVVNGTVIVNINKIKLNTPPEEYTTSRPGVGIAKTDLDVEFTGDFTPANLTFSMTMRDDVGDVADLISANASAVENNLLAEFGLAPTAENISNLVNSTPVLIHAELSATNLTAADVTGVPISITVNKDWFYTVAGGDPSNVMMFKINGTTGEVEKIKLTEASITVNDGTVTFSATFDHFCVFALAARPPVAVAPTAVIHRGVRPTPTPTPALIPPVPRDTAPPIISNVTVTIERYVIISWDTNEKSDSIVKCGMKSGQYTIEEHLPKYVLSHVITLKQIRLKNIYENTTYYFVVNSTDPSGNLAQTEEYIFVLTPPEKRAIMPFILQIPITLYTHLWWILPTTILVLIITTIVMPRYKSKRNFDSLTEKPTGTEILLYLYTTFPNVSRPADISKNTNVNLNGVLEALHTISNRNKLESLLGIGLVDKVEYEGVVCYYISKRGKTLIDGLK